MTPNQAQAKDGNMPTSSECRASESKQTSDDARVTSSRAIAPWLTPALMHGVGGRAARGFYGPCHLPYARVRLGG